MSKQIGKSFDGIIYNCYEKPKGSELSAKTDQHRLFYHKLGTSQKEDNIIGTFNGGENILLKVGRYGPYVELQESKKRKWLVLIMGNL